MPVILIALAALAAMFMAQKAGGSQSVAPELEHAVPPDNVMGAPDCLPEFQHGIYKQDFDEVFEAAAKEFGIPFALLKAHAIRESSLKPNATNDEGGGRQSYGLMQIMWWSGSNRFADWGYSDDVIGDGSILFDPTVNVRIAAQLILDNWSRLRNLRDTINAYNTGVRESVRIAPANYVDNVLNYWSTMVGVTVS